MEESSKILQVRGVKFILKDRRLTATGNAYLSSTVNSEKKLLSCDKETQVDLCIKDIVYNEAGNCVSLYDTRDMGYDIFVHDNIGYASLSFMQSDTYKYFVTIVGGLVATVGVGYFVWKSFK